MRRSLALCQATLAGLTALIASCTEAPREPSSAPPTTHVSFTPPSSWIPSTPPPIPQADAAAYRDKPCDLFTDEEAKALGYSRTRDPFVDGNVSWCRRTAGGVPGDEFILKYHQGDDYFGDIYRREAEWPSNGAVARTVGGQPAVSVALERNTACWLVVGLADNQSVEVRIANKKDVACDLAATVAETIVKKLK